MAAISMKIEKFTGRNNFNLWQIKMQALLKQQGLWAPLSGKSKKESIDEEEWITLEEKAHSTILLCLANDIITEVATEKTAAGLWLKLESLYMTKSLTNKLHMKQRLFSLHMEEGTSLRNHLDQLNTILLDLRNIDVKIDDEDAALILLVSLPQSYENFVDSFIAGKDSLSLEDVRSALHTREVRHKASGSGSENQASGLASTSSRRQQSGNRKANTNSNSAGLKDDICHYCKEKGHWKFDCPKLKKYQEKKESSVVVAEETNSDFEDGLALAVNEQVHHQDVWYLDTAADYHMCPSKECFSTYEKIDGGHVSMANGVICKIVGRGSVRMRTHDGSIRTLNNVRHIPEMTKNLISLSLLDNKEFSFKGEGGVLFVYKGSKVILKGVKCGALYGLQGSVLTCSAGDKCTKLVLNDKSQYGLDLPNGLSC
ncbi:unnamed protein product [Linum trigynum]|uniref:CCHC-type domain-containing protein n=1 Tax=Linum trigynum TaxID=586398 RepID=A0AAV2GFP5_9ROSI